ncbi:light-harvesting complex-like protein OHP2, chloroplastic [Cynara cardunculus var. scolymus]|uniref:Chlorophyll a/b binding protein domain-containing protein n=1 Tax=Cynara cardunculus var. scolymus TaxID=59895 RepID=A0A124SEB2_CYNCS|nr:light-harvesting complex-like protein OHP2, chloroplastic [Cynara cardunculus var. scolymus]KVH99567.1 Chlorophyll a/b binding protein domain-containing protein [Cynara cardunculus var. scolymus]
MSIASLQYIRITDSSSNPSSPSSSTAGGFRSCASKRSVVTIRCSQTDGPLRRPSIATPPVRPAPLTPPSSPPPPPPDTTAVVGQNVVTMEFQRQKAKELQEYFKQKKLEDAANQGPFFGFIGKNEISNGRWAMFGFAVGMLTEYATGSDFVDQVKILLSNFGIVDLE